MISKETHEKSGDNSHCHRTKVCFNSKLIIYESESILYITKVSKRVSQREPNTYNRREFNIDDSDLKEDEKLVSLSIPISLFRKIEDRIKDTSFSSVSSYLSYVVQELMLEMERAEPKESFSKDDEESVKERLRALGYLG